ncbi:MAG: heavy-metal-associated domain-containing protein [Desulfomonile tiedjei]|nr:heavy-metal-associated domain-containing protein [Desulfomonile tiedjei]
MKETVKIKGMSCNHCVMAVIKALKEVDGVADVQVDLAQGEATLESQGAIDMKQVASKIEKAGYELG